MALQGFLGHIPGVGGIIGSMRLTAVLACLLLLAACSSGSDEPKAQATVTVTAEPSTSASPAADPLPVTAEDMARALVKEAGVKGTKVLVYTEKTDPNGILGTPSGYTAAALIKDPRITCDEPAGVRCGVVVEQWSSAAKAIQRGAYIESLSGNGAFGSNEWDLTTGPLLIRVTGSLKPSKAAPWRQAAEALGAVPAN